nr:PREDICTED: 2'-5'-oligoadenylate synthase-like protein 2 [Latimeria chalumnae]|eukprot:XP_014340651.1 PREDICTED: 2'-5'-oligoadenylate synthase-like protein 2 [Latimeria chalumnae]
MFSGFTFKHQGDKSCKGPITTKPDAQVYADLINANAIPGEFSTCFTELQRNFVKYCRPKVKGLLRLVKYWYKTYAKPMRQEGRLPPKYALELLTIYVWETGSGKESFKTEEGFRTVLEMICNYEDICVYWTEYYDFQNAVVGNHLRKMLTAKRPIILDPADPTGNVASGGRWDLLAKEAAECLRTPCVNTATAWDVNPTKHITVTVIKRTPAREILLELNVNPFHNVAAIQESIHERLQIPTHMQQLWWKTEELMSWRTLTSYGIYDDVTIQFHQIEESMCCII